MHFFVIKPIFLEKLAVFEEKIYWSKKNFLDQNFFFFKKCQFFKENSFYDEKNDFEGFPTPKTPYFQEKNFLRKIFF